MSKMEEIELTEEHYREIAQSVQVEHNKTPYERFAGTNFVAKCFFKAVVKFTKLHNFIIMDGKVYVRK